MADLFFVNSAFTVTQNASLYAQNMPADYTIYDYILDINAGIGGWTTMNELFNNKDFVQNSAQQNNGAENGVTVNLTANLDAINTLLFASNAVDISSTMTSVTSNAAYNTLNRNSRNLLGLRFLEIVATKIFGHAKARAAIANDSDFYRPSSVGSASIINQIATGINNSLQNRKYDLFNAYAQYDRIQDNNTNDVEVSANFNFDNTNWEFPIFFVSQLQDIGADGNLSELNNGPSVGGNTLTSGTMNVPILLRFRV